MYNDLILETLSGVSFDWGSIVDSINISTNDGRYLSIDGNDMNWSPIP